MKKDELRPQPRRRYGLGFRLAADKYLDLALTLLGNRSVMDTPFNQTSYTSQTVLDQQARTITDVLDNDPSVRPTGPAAFGTEPLNIRGFSVANTDISMNGIYGIAPAISASTDFVERVEVLKGPSVLLNGMPPGGSVGGTVNIVSKRAGDEPLTQFTTSYASKTQFGEHVDVARRFGQDNICGARFNGSYAGGETAIDENKDYLGLAALGLDCHATSVRFSADFGYQARRTNDVTRFVSFTSTSLPVVPAPQADKLYSPPWWYLEAKDLFGMVNVEADIAQNATPYASAGMHRLNDSYLYGNPAINNANGNYSTKPSAGHYYYDNLAAQVGARTTIDTWAVDHAIDLNASSLDRIYSSASVSGTAFSSNIYNPSYAAYQNLIVRNIAK